MIDWSRVSELYEDFGEDEFSEIIDVFLEEGVEGLEQLSFAQSDAQNMAAFHFLKGAALNLGFVELSQICALGETAAREGQDVTLLKAQVLEHLPATCQVLKTQWRQYLVGSS
ncbi:MAG: Hpt domain-containing protein [Roseinatronobacter sp.]|jgi:HPt (histidine-containing phosphotransfer) domain-containing protein|nr:Hpt domain-containing protein [Roseinatronobacter sp.]